MNNYVSVVCLSSGPDYYNDLSSESVIPLKLQDTNDDSIIFNQRRIKYEDGYKFYIPDIFKNTKDVKFQNDTLVWLTTSINYNDYIQKENSIDSLEDHLNEFGFYYTYFLVRPPQKKSNWFLKILNGQESLTSVDQGNLFKISKINEHVTINSGDLFFTVDKKTKEFSFELRTSNEYKIQLFNYKIFVDGINLFFKDDYTYQLAINSKGEIKANSVNSSRYNKISNNFSEKKENNSIFYIRNVNPINYEKGVFYNKNQSWVSYYNEIFDKENKHNVEIREDKSFHNVPLNYLFISPVESKISLEEETIEINSIPLKNMMTHEQDYFISKNVDGSDTVKLREYNKVYNGNKLQLGFTDSTKRIIFQHGKETYFHFPYESLTTPLSSSGLIESGALPGSTPFNSDRIYKKNANYKEYIHWGDSQQFFGCDNGVWLCSWLSGGDMGSLEGMENPVWMDRWYDPSKITENKVLELGYNDIKIEEKTPRFFDVPSELTFEGGVYYKYFRNSNKDLITLIDTFNVGNTALRLSFKDSWGEVVPDNSNWGNNGNVTEFYPSQIIKKGPSFNGLEQYSLQLKENNIRIPYSQSLDLSGSFTVSMWVKSDNWKNNKGVSLYSNGFRGGSDIKINEFNYNPVVGVVEKHYAHSIIYSQCNPISDLRLELFEDSPDLNNPFANPINWTWCGVSSKGPNPLSWVQINSFPFDFTWEYTVNAECGTTTPVCTAC